jgi:hypothetical protein
MRYAMFLDEIGHGKLDERWSRRGLVVELSMM